jgi:hypothetical protein
MLGWPQSFGKAQWHWQVARSNNIVKIQSKLSLVDIGEIDQAIWSISKSGVYNCTDTWRTIWQKQPSAVWWKLVWFPLAIPKHAFNVWFAAQDSLTTWERLIKRGIKGNVLCVCRGGIEGRDHLFFECGFYRRVWVANLRSV